VATILVLDAEADSCLLFKRFLEREGHKVLACEERGQALKLASSTHLDLAIVNVDSGRKNRAEVAHLLKAHISGLRVLVIMDFVPEERERMASSDDFLLKPVELDAMEAKVRDLLDPSEETAS
jgi:two-component system, OmpR family, alkaline phosphatase synthesis response regulator PhoP